MVYERPRVADYGTLGELTAELAFGVPLAASALSGPIVPPPGGPDNPGPNNPGPSFTPQPSGGELPSGGLGEGQESGGRGGVGGGNFGGEGGSGGVVSTGGGDEALPFTGFPAAIAAAAGAGIAGAGAALRRALRERR